MSTLPNFLRSLLLTSVLSFTAPVVIVVGMLGCLIAIGYLPNLETAGQVGVEQLSKFLETFGSGNSVQGLLTIGLACSLVGVLFDAYTFYRQQNLRGR